MITGTTLFLPTYPTMPHMTDPLRRLDLFSEAETEFFDDGIRQNLAGNPFDFCLRLFARQNTIEGEFEIFSLPHAFQALVAHFLQRAVDGFTLRIENALLERNVNAGCHKATIIREGQTDEPGPFWVVSASRLLLDVGYKLSQ